MSSLRPPAAALVAGLALLTGCGGAAPVTAEPGRPAHRHHRFFPSPPPAGPARGRQRRRPGAAVDGLRLRLKSSVDTSGLPEQARVIARAMRTHGLIVADNGSAWYNSGSPDERWTTTPCRR